MKQSLFTMEHARQLTADTYELVLSGDTSAITAPGQFVNIQLPGKFLRRPISICNWTKDALLLLVRVVGEGTHDLVRCVPGTELDVLSGLGNGFDLAKGGAHPILLGGGICGLGGLYIVMNASSGVGGTWVHNCVGGRGWIAVALVIFATWSPTRAILGSLVFGALSIMRLYINLGIPAQIYSIFPYIATVIVLIAVSMRRKRENQPPNSLGLAYFREER